MRGGVSETACPCYSSSPVPVPGPGPRSPVPKCTLLLLESWPGAEPSDKPELLVFSKTGMPQSQQFNRFHTLNSSVSLALSRASLIVPASLETSQLGQQPTFRPPFKGALSYFIIFLEIPKENSPGRCGVVPNVAIRELPSETQTSDVAC